MNFQVNLLFSFYNTQSCQREKSGDAKMAKKRKHRKNSASYVFSPLGFAVRKIKHHAYFAGALLIFSGIAILVYTMIIAPLTGRWRGLYGNVTYPAEYSIRGIDVSHHQGKIDWDELKDAKIGDEPISFVFIKATEGVRTTDKNFTVNFKEADECGIIRGAYHFYVPGASARKQAENFIKHVHLQDGDLPPVLDIESTGDLNARQLQDSALVWLKVIERHYGVTPILYTNYKFKEQYLSASAFDKYPYWIAHYYVREPQFKGNWKFWQHTDRGRLPGIKEYVDINCYNGSMYDLKRMTIKQ